MSLNNILITLFIFCSNISSFLVIITSNAIYSVLYLILVFCFNTLILLSLGTEFLALIFLIVYVGAIAVLFLFVVMMLNIKGSKKKNKFFYNILFYILTFSLLLIIFLYNIVNINNFIFFKSFIEKIKELLFLSFEKNNFILNIDLLNNINQIGQIIYTYNFIHLNMAGIILLEAMIGAIVLTILKHKKIKQQNVFNQLSRDFRNATFLTSFKKKNLIISKGSKNYNDIFKGKNFLYLKKGILRNVNDNYKDFIKMQILYNNRKIFHLPIYGIYDLDLKLNYIKLNNYYLVLIKDCALVYNDEGLKDACIRALNLKKLQDLHLNELIYAIEKSKYP